MAFGFTRTLPTIAGSHSDFSVLLIAGSFPAAAIDGGASSIINGGGNLRAYTDSTKATQISLEIVTFVTGVSPVIQVWVKIPVAATGNTIYLEADSVATSQPAFGAAFGRNSVWTGYETVLHLSENVTNGVFADSTGNGHDTTLTTGASLSVTSTGHPYGGTWPDFTGNEVLTLTSSAALVDNTAFCAAYWVSVDLSSNADGLFGNRWNTPDNNWVQAQTSLRVITKAASTENVASPPAPTGGTQHGEFCQNNAALTVYTDGAQSAQDTSVTAGEGIVGANDFRVGTYFDNSAGRRYQGRIGAIKVKRNVGSDNLRFTEYDNQSDATNWGTSSAWADAGGAGVTANGSITLPSLILAGSATDSDPAITISGSITLPSLVFSGSATDSTSEVTANGSITMPSLVLSGSATDSTSTITASGSITLPSLVLSGSATDGVTGVTANGSVTIPALTFAGSATDSTLEITANGNITLPSLVLSGSASDTTPGVTATGTVTLPSLVFSGSATDSTSEVTASGSITLPSLALAGTATAGEIITDYIIEIDVSIKTIQTTLSTFTIEV